MSILNQFQKTLIIRVVRIIRIIRRWFVENTAELIEGHFNRRTRHKYSNAAAFEYWPEVAGFLKLKQASSTLLIYIIILLDYKITKQQTKLKLNGPIGS